MTLGFVNAKYALMVSNCAPSTFSERCPNFAPGIIPLVDTSPQRCNAGNRALRPALAPPR